MTVQERATALEAAGFTPRQAQFLGLAALVSGVCSRRHYETFARVRPGKNVRAFLDGLVARGWAHRVRFRQDRGHVYHLAGKALYRLLGDPDNRHRRPPTAVVMAQRLMVLDAVLAQPEAQWLATEHDKVTALSTLGVARHHFPRRAYHPTTGVRSTRPTVRHFLEKRPLGLAADGTLTWLYLALDPSAQRFERFLHDHAAVLTRLPRWAVRVVYPPPVRTQRTHMAVFDRWYRDLPKPVTQAEAAWAVATHGRLTNGAGDLSLDDLHRLQDLVHALGADRVEAWSRHPPTSAEAWARVGVEAERSQGRLEAHVITHRYDQFGSQPGLA